MKFSHQILIVLIALQCIAYVKCGILDHLKEVLSKQRTNHGAPVHDVQRRSLNDDGIILGHASHPSHLPKAEPILPGHTLLRPTFGMLKSSLRFPHKEMENGFGVYGNTKNLGVRYGNANERIEYSGFRRMPGRYIMIDSPTRNSNRYKYAPQQKEVSSLLLDSAENESGEIRTFDQVLQHLQKLNTPIRNENLNVYLAKLYGNDKSRSSSSSQESSIEPNPQQEVIPNNIYKSLASVFANIGQNGVMRSSPDKFDFVLTLPEEDVDKIPKTPFEINVKNCC